MTPTAAPGETDDLLDAPYDDELLTTADLAAITRSPASTVRYWRYLGTGPRGFRIGRRVLYRRSEVMRWLAELEAEASLSRVARSNHERVGNHILGTAAKQRNPDLLSTDCPEPRGGG